MLLNFNPFIITPEARKTPNGMASAWGLVLVNMLWGNDDGSQAVGTVIDGSWLTVR